MLDMDTLDTGETSLMLRLALGPVRTNWSDFLADCIRDRASLSGLQLQPIVRIKLPGDRCKRPRYTTQDVKNFILEAVRILPRPTAADRALHMVKIEIDPAMLALPLAMRRAKPA